jgi:flavin-dependent dehydrogenase
VTDLLVAGGGPVGLAVAVRARLAGLDVTVVEPRPGPVDKACGEGLMPSAVAALRALGIEPAGRPFTGIAYVRDGLRVEARFRRGPGLGVRRTVLHAVLAARAAALGVTTVRDRVESVVQDGSGVEAAGLRARWLVAADGLHSPVRRGLGLDRPARSGWGGARYGLRQHFRVAPWTDVVEVHWSAGAEAYVTPVADDLVGVALLGPAGPGFRPLLAQFPQLLDRLGDAPTVTAVRGAGPLRQRARAASAGRVLLVGDAAGYVDALTGEGIATGLATAQAALDAVRAGHPERYDAAWRAATRRYRWTTSALLAAAQLPVTRRALVPAAVRAPGLFARIVDSLA